MNFHIYTDFCQEEEVDMFTGLSVILDNIPGPNTSSFMHASTASGTEGDSAWLETQRMSSNRECQIQCLQFYYYHSGNELDVLNIWLREFQDEWDSQGSLRLVGQITGNVKLAVWLLSALNGI